MRITINVNRVADECVKADKYGNGQLFEHRYKNWRGEPCNNLSLFNSTPPSYLWNACGGKNPNFWVEGDPIPNNNIIERSDEHVRFMRQLRRIIHN